MDRTPDNHEDIVDYLQRQHTEIRALFAEVAKTTGEHRRDRFRELVRLLAVHETAEELVVHPAVRDLTGGKKLAEARLGEEHRAKELLSTLDKLGPGRDGFDTLLEQLREDVLAHAEHEERDEFPLLRKKLSAERRRAMASTAKTAESIAPTHPHPGVEGSTANLLLGPPVAIVDRARDAIRSALNR
ncbi:hemerythrin domain-containing protein [Amycolatopsis sp. 195334CR]|uniref:hemerythrin domain-containing protein n=1 Tax=Amycolatopsis sp. 195334CR TaxID=2814588 RepID=UPI001A8E439E|nr:hemerythrin domain-containing protein [Amycolatopsis sp. 195334CR]MBN6039028.1 hemerythrin domain-containing protein [Amycolatopsis sp. 195334CR]